MVRGAALEREQGKGSCRGKKRLSLAERPGILSLHVSMGSPQCVLIHPSQRALKRGFPKPANKSLLSLSIGILRMILRSLCREMSSGIRNRFKLKVRFTQGSL